MKKYLLVDGYNIIFAWSHLTKIANDNLEEARDKLIGILSNFSGYTAEQIILVFDAYKVNNGIETVSTYNRIKIIYTKERETADSYIERVSKVLAKQYKVRVATADRVESLIILGHGASPLSPDFLLKEVDTVKKEIRQIAEREIKNNLLTDNIDKKSLEILEKMRLDS